MTPSRPFILRPVATALLMFAILLAGIVAYFQLPISALPQVDYPTIQVATFYPGADPVVMSSSVTSPLERQFGQVPGLSQMTSTSSLGSSIITLQFQLDQNIDVAEQEVQAAINAAQAVGGGTVFFPPGRYLVSNSLLFYSNIRLLGPAPPSLYNGEAPAVIRTTSGFPASTSVIRASNIGVTNYAVEIQNLLVQITSVNTGIVGVDWTCVSYGRLINVAVEGPTSNPPFPAGSIGFKFWDNAGSSLMCFFNYCQRLDVWKVETGFRYISAAGNTAYITLQNFTTSNTKYGIWTTSIGGIGLSFLDGYMFAGSTPDASAKAFRRDSASQTIQAMNVRGEAWPNVSDIPIDGANPQLQIVGISSWAQTAPVHLSGEVEVGILTETIDNWNGGVGGSPGNPVAASTYPGPASWSYWAKVPSGTALKAGENAFTFYTQAHPNPSSPRPGLHFRFNIYQMGGLTQPLTWACKNVITAPFGTNVETYQVKLYLSSAFTLTSDLIFFIQAGRGAVGLDQ